MALIKLIRVTQPKTTVEYRIMSDVSAYKLEAESHLFFGDTEAPDLRRAKTYLQNVIAAAPGNDNTYKHQNPISLRDESNRLSVIITGVTTRKERILCAFENINQSKKTTMSDFKNVLLTEIKPDPNQPRKYYDESAMQELTDSVREKGILQPILIRPNGKGYVLVCGERRYRAATSAGLQEVPAVIRELSDDEALELQIIENLQRKDVHPMEEAVAFKSLMEKGKDIHDIAARVAKSEFYIRQRLRLNDLSKKFQKAFYAGRMSNATALKLCVIESKLQDEIYSEVENVIGEISFSEWDFKRMKGDLSKAPFSLEDKTLNKKMGACTGCSFNSAVSLLFPEHAEAPRCTNITCFKIKSDANYSKALAEYKDDPEIVFISKEYYHSTNSKEGAALAKEGLSIVARNSYSTVDAPEKPTWEEFEEDYNGDFDTEKELRNAFEKEVSDYNNDLVDYNKKISSGKFKKSFIVDGDEKGRIVYIQLNKTSTSNSGSSKSTKEKEAAGKLTTADIDAEIFRIQEREKRSKELDAEKIHARIIEAIKTDKSLKTIPDKLTAHAIDATKILSLFLVQEHISFNTRDIIKKSLGLHGGAWGNDPKTMWEKLAALGDRDITFLIRQIMFDKFQGINPKHTNGFMFRKMAETLGAIPIDAYEIEQKEVADKRADKVTKRIAALREQKKELSKPTAKKTPVPTKKARASKS